VRKESKVKNLATLKFAAIFASIATLLAGCVPANGCYSDSGYSNKTYYYNNSCPCTSYDGYCNCSDYRPVMTGCCY
jgi:hypothetical protein